MISKMENPKKAEGTAKKKSNKKKSTVNKGQQHLKDDSKDNIQVKELKSKLLVINE